MQVGPKGGHDASEEIFIRNTIIIVIDDNVSVILFDNNFVLVKLSFLGTLFYFDFFVLFYFLHINKNETFCIFRA